MNGGEMAQNRPSGRFSRLAEPGGLPRDGSRLRWMLMAASSTARIFLASLGLTTAGAFCQEAPKPAATPKGLDPAAAKERIKEIAPGEFEIGGITIKAKTREIRVPTAVQLKKAPVEYMLVTETGKTHESVLVTKVTPADFQLALLLANFQPGTEGLANKDLPPDIKPVTPVAPQTPGAHRVTLTVEWSENGAVKRAPLSDWLLNINERKPPPDLGVWIFNGSRFDERGFVAAQEGSFIAVWLDQNAIINSPAKGNWDDALWISNPAAIPDEGTAVTLIIAPEKPATETKP